MCLSVRSDAKADLFESALAVEEGRRRNPNDWSYTGVPSTYLFERGFTGHEHLVAFGLINMNGRVYDPYTGRFLSPDNYIQAPDYTQSFNRFSYCFNNPMKFIDPSGYMPIFMQPYWNEYMSILMQADAYRYQNELNAERQAAGYNTFNELWNRVQHNFGPIRVYDEKGNSYTVYWGLNGYYQMVNGKIVYLQNTGEHIWARADNPVKDGYIEIEVKKEEGKVT